MPIPSTSEMERILVVQTAYPGDVILTLPLVQSLDRHLRDVSIDVVVVPRAAGLLAGHPAIDTVISYDKRGSDSGIGGLRRLAKNLHKNNYQLALVPHRSLRSAALVWLTGVPRRIGFNTSSGKWLLSETVSYETSLHEVFRNTKLLEPLGIPLGELELPCLYPSDEDRSVVDRFLTSLGSHTAERFVTIAPGTVWNTKRWLPERYIELAKKIVEDGYPVILAGGDDDRHLCETMAKDAGSQGIFSSAGELSWLQFANLLQRSALLISNDSAPMHVAVAMRTPVVAIFGATIPEFGFAPNGLHDVVVEMKGLSCRPCSKHGGSVCPISTFACMKGITVGDVYTLVRECLDSSSPGNGAGRIRA